MADRNASNSQASVGIGDAVVADHQVAVRGPGTREDFKVAPKLAGMATLTERLKPYAGALVVAEATAGTWLPPTVAVKDAGCRIGFVANRDSARLRKAVAGPNKTDVIDAALLASCEQILGVNEAAELVFGQVGLRRALRRRHIAVVAAHRAACRLWALSAWAFPDVWRACGGHRVAQPVLRRWPELASLARAQIGSTRSRGFPLKRRATRAAGRAHQDGRAWMVVLLVGPT